MTVFRTPWEPDPAPAMAQPAWLYHHLTITGPAGVVAGFAAAARGSGVAPWQIDSAALQEDVFNLAAAQPPAQRSLSIEGCRILARQFRDRAEARQARAVALAGRSWACPFDLHTLLPVPDGILQHGPTHPAALSLAGGALGHPRRPAAGRRAARCTTCPPVAAGPRRPWLRLLHQRRHAARRGRAAGGTLDTPAFRTAAASGLRRGGRHDR